MKTSLGDEARALLSFAWPLMVAQSGLGLMGLVDTFVVGRVSARDMAGVALGNSVAGIVTLFGVGIVLGIEPLVSQAHGAGEHPMTRHWFRQGAWIAIFAVVPMSILIVVATFLFARIGIPPEIDATATAYLWARLPSLGFNTFYCACRVYLTGTGRTRPILIAVVAANILNAALDSVLVFVFDMGAVGVGLATSFCWACMWGVTFIAVRATPGVGPIRPVRHDIAKVLKAGWPIGVQISAESGVFVFVSLMIARFGETSLAGHEVALTLATTSFNCAQGVGAASAVRVGHHVGACRSDLARRTGFLGMGIGAGFMGIWGLVFLIFTEPLARAFTTDPAVVQAAVPFLRIAAIFSIADGVQVVAAGALRGAGDTRWAFYVNILAHWCIGVPMSLILGHVLELGPIGYWWALSIGLAGVAVLLSARFVVLSSRPIQRL